MAIDRYVYYPSGSFSVTKYDGPDRIDGNNSAKCSGRIIKDRAAATRERQTFGEDINEETENGRGKRGRGVAQAGLFFEIVTKARRRTNRNVVTVKNRNRRFFSLSRILRVLLPPSVYCADSQRARETFGKCVVRPSRYP